MSRSPCRSSLALLAAVALAGCSDATLQTTTVPPTPAEVVEAAPVAPPAEEPGAGSAVAPVDLAAAPSAPKGAAPSEGAVTLKRLKWDELQSQVLANPDAKYTIVDAWATTCGPCKENFPHLVEMNKKYAAKGLNVVSLTLDDISDPKAIEEAEKFLREKEATFTNVLLDEEFGVGFEKLNINAIPAVFVFGPDGKEVKRFTMDDADNQFTYDQVEREVVALLEGK